MTAQRIPINIHSYNIEVAHDTNIVYKQMKQTHIFVDINKVDPHKLQEMLNELATIDGVNTDKGIIEYDETNAEQKQQIRVIYEKYMLE